MPVSNRPTRRLRLRPALDRLEPRTLMAYAGSLDTTFGGGTGAYILPLGSGSSTRLENLTQVQVEPDGSVIAAGPATVSGAETVGLIRLNADGSPDTSFGTGGEADITLPGGVTAFEGITSLLIQPATGQITLVMAATSATQSTTVVARLDADGSPDSSYGTDGFAILTPTSLGISASFNDAALGPDGKVVLVGNEAVATTPDYETDIVAVAQLDASGHLDTSFAGTGVSTVSDVTPADLAKASGLTPAYEMGNGVAIQANGQVVVLGFLFDTVNPSGTIEQTDLIRLNSDGSRDTSLSQAGIQASGVDEAGRIIIEPDGSFLIQGELNGTAGLGLAHLNADGSLDKVIPITNVIGGLDDVSLLPDGKISLTSGENMVLRYNADLTPDATFGEGGVATVNVPLPPPKAGTNQGNVVLSASAVGPDGKVVVVGSNPYGTRVGILPPTDLAVARLTSTGTSAHPGDFNGDGIADPAIYLPTYGAFAIGDSTGKTTGEVVPFGIPGPGQTIPAPGNYYGTGQEDIAAYLPALGLYAIQDPTGNTTGKSIPFGIPGTGQTIPAPGDYYGTGQDDVAVYLAAYGAFAVQDPTGNTAGMAVPFGMPGLGNSIPVPGDYDGSSKTEFAVYLPNQGAFAYRPADGGADVVTYFGMPGIGNSIPMPGDYDGSGKTEMAVYIPSLGDFIYRPANGGADVVIPFGSKGVGQTLPMQGDYSGVGHDELGVYLPTFGSFAYRPTTGNDVVEAFGIAGAGQTIPVTTTVLSPFPGSSSGQGFAVRIASILGEPDSLDFLPTATTTGKAKPGDRTT